MRVTEGAWRPGLATRCSKCGSEAMTYQEDGAAVCNACGAVTQPVWFTPPAPAPATANPPDASPQAPTLRFVSPPSSPAAVPPATAYRAPVRRASGRDLREQRLLGGAILLLIGLVVTGGTYALAASSPGGGTYLIAFGPVLLGIYYLARGLMTPAGMPALQRRARTRPTAVAAAPSYPAPAAPPVATAAAYPVAAARSAPKMAPGTKWPLVLLLVGVGLFFLGIAITPADFGAGEAIGLPGFFAMIIAPVWWGAAKLRNRSRKGTVCATCGAPYPADWHVCPKDGTPLQPAR